MTDEEIEVKDESVDKAAPAWDSTSTGNIPIQYTSYPEKDFDKDTVYTLNNRGEVERKQETLRDKGLIHFGTGSKGEVKAKNIDVVSTDLEELIQIAKKVKIVQSFLNQTEFDIDEDCWHRTDDGNIIIETKEAKQDKSEDE